MNGSELDRLAWDFVKLCFYLDQHQPGYVDAYYGPPELRAEAISDDLSDPTAFAADLEEALQGLGRSGLDESARLRWKWLTRHTRAIRSRFDQMLGVEMSFDEASDLLYDAVCPSFPDDYYYSIIKEVDSLVPGEGPLVERLESFRNLFVVPPEKVRAVVEAAVAEGRVRTARYVRLPAGEEFSLEYVSGEPWLAYNWFKGLARSVIQLNTDLPLSLEYVMLIACHEGYPGHHVFHSLRERDLYRGRGWMEASIVPLHSPIAVVAEGLANFGLHVVFPSLDERIAFEREKICPLAGFPEDKVALHDRIVALTAKLGYAEVDAARQYLDGEIPRASAVERLVAQRLYSPELAEAQMGFIEQYHAYIVNYAVGEDLVKRYVEARGGAADHPEVRWQEYSRLLTLPVLPGDLTASSASPS